MTEGPVDQLNRPEPASGKRFIHDHHASMDPCTNPGIFYHHAQYVAHDLGPRPRPKLAMQFAYCSTPLFHDIQPPTFISWTADVTPRENDPPWAQKTDERLLWRGSNTGINHNAHTRWQHAQRIRLVRMAGAMDGAERVLLPPTGAGVEDEERLRVGEGVDMQRALINPAMMDIAFTGEPIGCDLKYCNYLKTLFEWRRNAPANSKEVGNHKYFVDVDGNGWSSRFKRLITTNSLVFKATAYPEWCVPHISCVKYIQSYFCMQVDRPRAAVGTLCPRAGRLLRPVRRVHVLPRRAVRRGKARRARGEDCGGGPRVEQGVLAQGGHDRIFLPVRLMFLSPLSLAYDADS